MKRWLITAAVATALLSLVAIFQIRATDDGLSLSYRWRAQGQECDEGGGCVVMSRRQVAQVVMLMLQGVVDQHQPPHQKPKRDDV